MEKLKVMGKMQEQNETEMKEKDRKGWKEKKRKKENDDKNWEKERLKNEWQKDRANEKYSLNWDMKQAISPLFQSGS